MAFVSLSLLLIAVCLHECLQLSMCLPLLCPGVGEVWFFCSADGELRHGETLQLIVKQRLGQTSVTFWDSVVTYWSILFSVVCFSEGLPLQGGRTSPWSPCWPFQRQIRSFHSLSGRATCKDLEFHRKVRPGPAVSTSDCYQCVNKPDPFVAWIYLRIVPRCSSSKPCSLK